MSHRRRLFILYSGCLLVAANAYALLSYVLRSQPPAPSPERVVFGLLLQVTFFGFVVLYLRLLPAGNVRIEPGHWLNPRIPLRFIPVFASTFVVTFGYAMFNSGLHCPALPFPLKGPVLCW